MTALSPLFGSTSSNTGAKNIPGYRNADYDAFTGESSEGRSDAAAIAGQVDSDRSVRRGAERRPRLNFRLFQ